MLWKTRLLGSLVYPTMKPFLGLSLSHQRQDGGLSVFYDLLSGLAPLLCLRSVPPIFPQGAKVRSGQVWERAPEQQVAASTFCRYSRDLHLAFPRQMPGPFPSPCDADQLAATTRQMVSPLTSSTQEAPSLREYGEQDQRQENEPHAHTAAAHPHGLRR